MLGKFVIILAISSCLRISCEKENIDYKIENTTELFNNEIDKIHNVLNFHIDIIFYGNIIVLVFIILIGITIHIIIQEIKSIYEKCISIIDAFEKNINTHDSIYNERFVKIEKLLDKTQEVRKIFK
jgi:hypothetical protein